MAITADVLAFRRFAENSRALSLLRSNNAPVVLGVVANYFPRGTASRPAAEVYELMVDDLRMLSTHGVDMSRTPQEYCTDWVRHGWLIRRPGTARTGETLAPSEDALAALDTARRWSQPHSSVTASRVESLSSTLQILARDTDDDMASRLERLEQEKEEIENRIAEVSRGEFERLSPYQVRERIDDLLETASAIPADFVRVRGEFDGLNRRLRQELLDPDNPMGDILEDIFRGVDVIGSSDAGKSFNGFYSVLLDSEQSVRIEDWITTILDRPEADELPEGTRRQLRRLFRDMEDTAAEVSDVLTSLARSLRQYVTTEEFSENRRMAELLRSAKSAASRAMETGGVKARTPVSVPLQRVGMTIDSVSALRLHNPGDINVESAPEELSATVIDEADISELVRTSEIDTEELLRASEDVVGKHGSASVATVLTAHPATQGLASVVGLLDLMIRHGSPTGSEETVTWEEDGVTRRARITGMSISAAGIKAAGGTPTGTTDADTRGTDPND